MQTGITGCTLDFRKSQDAQEESKYKPILFADIVAASGATFIIIVTERYSWFNFRKHPDIKFAVVDLKYLVINQRLAIVDQKFTAVNQRLDQLNSGQALTSQMIASFVLASMNDLDRDKSGM